MRVAAQVTHSRLPISPKPWDVRILKLNGLVKRYSQIKWIFSIEATKDKWLISFNRNSHAKMALDSRGKIHLSNALSAQSAVNVWITSSSSTSVTCVASYLLMFDIITSGELILAQQGIRRPVQYCHPPPAKSLPSRNSAVSTIRTNVEPPEIRYGGTIMLSPVLAAIVWFRNRLSRAHFHAASGRAFRSQLWPIIPRTVDEKRPVVIFDQPDPRALRIYEHRQATTRHPGNDLFAAQPCPDRFAGGGRQLSLGGARRRNDSGRGR
jgi:hypothetical protein